MLLAALLLLPVGLALLSAGLRGRRTDDHPLCCRCGYDLTGQAAGSTRCPECGADLTGRRAVRVGHRALRRGLVAFAVLLLVTGGVGGGMTAWPRVRAFDPLPHEPLWWLRHRIGGSAASRDVAFTEVARRTPWVTADQLAPFVDKALTIQATPSILDGAAYCFVEAVHNDGKLSADRWATYARQACWLKALVRPTVIAGDPLPLEFPFDRLRLGDAQFNAVADLTSLSIDSKLVALTPKEHSFNGPEGRLLTVASHALGDRGTDQSVGFLLVAGSATAGLSPGTHVIEGTVRITIYDENQWPPGDPSDAKLEPPRPVAVVDRCASAHFSVVIQPALTVNNEAFRPAIQNGLTVRPICVSRDGTSADLDYGWQDVPARLAYRVSIRWFGSPELPAGEFDDSVPFDCLNTVRGASELGSTTQADVIFRPDVEAARRSLDATPIWNGTVVVHNVPVYREGQPMPATRPIRVDGTE